MRRIVVVIVALVLVLLVASQLVLPRLAEHSAAGQLTRGGGSADVSVSAFPALRLLFGHGDSLRVDGRGLVLPTEGKNGMEGLNRFSEVHILLRDSRAGPVTIRSFRLDRPQNSHQYEARLSGRTSPGEVAAFLGSRAAGPLGALL